MSLAPLRILAGLALLFTASAQAFNQNTPAGQWGVYTAHVRYQTETPNPSDPAIHLYGYQDINIEESTLALCQQRFNDAMNVATSPTFQIVGGTPCRWGSEAAGGLVMPAIDHGGIGDFIRYEHALRERFRIDEYETELKKLHMQLYRAN